MTGATSARADRLRRSLRRLGHELVDAERGTRRQGSKINETSDLFGLDPRGHRGLDQRAGEEGVIPIFTRPEFP